MEVIQKAVNHQMAQKTATILSEFRQFAFKGNVVDLAIGVIIGAAFSKIVDSLVKNVIMPLVSVCIPGNQSYMDWQAVINGKVISYGLFIGEVVNFLIVAFVLFLFVVKFLGWIIKSKTADLKEEPKPTKDQVLLMEIRDAICALNKG